MQRKQQGKILPILVTILSLGAIAVLFGGKSFSRYLLQRELDSLCPVSAEGSIGRHYAQLPEPMDIDSHAIMEQLSSVKNSLFFITGTNDGTVSVNYDGFVLPNGYYARPKVSWSKLISTTGEDIFDAPKTAQRNSNIPTPLLDNIAEIVCRDKKSTAAYAEGAVDLPIPCKFIHVEFNSSDKNTTQSVGKYTVKLKSCLRDRAELQIQGLTQTEFPIIVLRDANGRCLSMADFFEFPGPTRTAIVKAMGYIAKIVVYFPVEFADFKFNALATSEPKFTGVKTVAVKASRYFPDKSCKTMTVDSASLTAQIKIVSALDDSQINSHTPEIIVNFPNYLNTYFSKVDFGKPQFLDARGQTLDYSGSTVRDTVDSDLIAYRLTLADEHHTLPFSRAIGIAHITYPVNVKVQSLTPNHPRSGKLQAQFHGAIVLLTGIDSSMIPKNYLLLDDIGLVHAVDASGHQLMPLQLGKDEQQDGVSWQSFTFWGIPTEVQIYSVEKWLTLDLPFDLPSPKAE